MNSKAQTIGTNCANVLVTAMLLGFSASHSATEPTSKAPVFRADNIDFVAPQHTIDDPSNRWAPGERPFPVDLKVFHGKAREHLLNRKRVPVSFELAEIQIRSYQVTSLRSGPWHGENSDNPAWYVVLKFAAKEKRPNSGKPLNYVVVMMIDGTILEETAASNR